jgi:preprotein translocase subunit SecE
LARDRKRAKQRQQRRRGPGRAHPPAGSDHDQGNSQLTRADLPAALGHAGDVDEFDAALIRGAGGVPAPEDTDLDAVEALSEEPNGTPEQADGLSEGDALVAAGNGSGGAGAGGGPPAEGNGSALAAAAGDGGQGVTTAPVRAPARPAREQQSLPRRAIAFLRASWAELQRVQWPNRAQTTQATAVVLGFVAVAGIYFGVADYVAKEIVEAIL